MCGGRRLSVVASASCSPPPHPLVYLARQEQLKRCFFRHKKLDDGTVGVIVKHDGQEQVCPTGRARSEASIAPEPGRSQM